MNSFSRRRFVQVVFAAGAALVSSGVSRAVVGALHRLSAEGRNSGAIGQPLAYRPKFVQLRGRTFTVAGRRIVLRGCNLGCWLLIEPAQLSWPYPDQYSVDKILSHRFGRPAERGLMDLYRTNFIRDRDFKLLKTFGLNIVRVPFRRR